MAPILPENNGESLYSRIPGNIPPYILLTLGRWIPILLMFALISLLFYQWAFFCSRIILKVPRRQLVTFEEEHLSEAATEQLDQHVEEHIEGQIQERITRNYEEYHVEPELNEPEHQDTDVEADDDTTENVATADASETASTLASPSIYIQEVPKLELDLPAEIPPLSSLLDSDITVESKVYGYSSEELQDLTRQIRKLCPLHKAREDGYCSLCKSEVIEDEQVRILPCGHSFHNLCILRWLVMSHLHCPYCDTSLQPLEHATQSVAGQ